MDRRRLLLGAGTGRGGVAMVTVQNPAQEQAVMRLVGRGLRPKVRF